MWVPRNRAKLEHVRRVTGLVTDPRARQYWDAPGATMDRYDRLLKLTGPCAGVFLLFPPDARWDGDGVPEPSWVEDAHAREFDRPWPQFDVERLADSVSASLRRAAP